MYNSKKYDCRIIHCLFPLIDEELSILKSGGIVLSLGYGWAFYCKLTSINRNKTVCQKKERTTQLNFEKGGELHNWNPENREKGR